VVMDGTLISGSDFWLQRPVVVFVFSLVASAIAFVIYAADKRAAKRGARRVSEATLHFWGLVGGWPGALLAQQVFRHKTRKLSFQMMFWTTVVLNCAAVVWVLSPPGVQKLFNNEDRSDLPRITPRSR
jgi:uncharacterized membrane protein YsdA (DUF1294 family)